MATTPVLDHRGKEVGRHELAAEIFDAPVSVPLIHQVVLAGLASIRRGTHKVKTRGEVSGGGRKPWRQKGTGRARQGSTRSPQWTGGGVAHGPVPRDHSMRVNKKMRRGALRGALTDAVRSGKLVLIQDLSFDEPKTKRAAEILDGLDLAGKVLLVLDRPSETGAVEKSFRNIQGVRIAYARSLGVYEVIAADTVLLTEGAIDVVEGAGEASPASATSEALPAEAAPAEAADGPSPMASEPGTDAAGADPPGGAEAVTTDGGGEDA
jgi:large subunit ribosomal protein L4